MSTDLLAICITAALQIAGIVTMGVLLGRMIRELPNRFSAGEAAIYHRLQEIRDEMRRSLGGA